MIQFTIVVDRKTSVRAEVNEDEAKPGYYLVSFSPPEALRDGLTHLVEIKVRNWRFKFKSTFLKRPEGGFLDPSASG